MGGEQQVESLHVQSPAVSFRHMVDAGCLDIVGEMDPCQVLRFLENSPDQGEGNKKKISMDRIGRLPVSSDSEFTVWTSRKILHLK